jgi:hypothetical protein
MLAQAPLDALGLRFAVEPLDHQREAQVEPRRIADRVPHLGEIATDERRAIERDDAVQGLDRPWGVTPRPA